MAAIAASAPSRSRSTRWGVKTRLTSPRRRVCSGGSRKSMLVVSASRIWSRRASSAWKDESDMAWPSGGLTFRPRPSLGSRMALRQSS